MVIQIGALKSGRDADVEADIRAVVEVAHAAGAIVKVIFENAYLTDDEKIRACHLAEAAGADFVKTSTGFAPSGRHARRPAPRCARTPRRTSRSRRPAACGRSTRSRGDGAGRHPDRRHGHRGDHPRLPGPQGRDAPRGRSVRRGGRLLMATRSASGMLGSGFIGEFHTLGLRYVPDARVVANCDADRTARAAFAARFGSRPAAHSIEAVCADPDVDLVVVSLPEPPPPRGGPGPRRPRARPSRAPSRSAGPPTSRRTCSARCATPASSRAYLENVVFNPDIMRMREMVAVGRHRPRHDVPRPRGPQRAARRALLGRGARRRRGAAGHGLPRHRVRALPVRQGPGVRDVFAWGDTLVHGARTTGEDNA